MVELYSTYFPRIEGASNSILVGSHSPFPAQKSRLPSIIPNQCMSTSSKPTHDHPIPRIQAAIPAAATNGGDEKQSRARVGANEEEHTRGGERGEGCEAQKEHTGRRARRGWMKHNRGQERRERRTQAKRSTNGDEAQRTTTHHNAPQQPGRTRTTSRAPSTKAVPHHRAGEFST